MEKIINLTQHACSNEQASEGVVEPSKGGSSCLDFCRNSHKRNNLGKRYNSC